MKKRVIFLAMLMGAVLASGCGSQGKQDNTPANTVEVLEESSDGHENEITGVVKEISDSQITLIIGETDRSGGRPGDGDAGNRVDKENAGRRPKETGNGSKTEGGDSKADESSGSDGGDAKEGADSGPNRADTGSRIEKGAEGRPARNLDEDEVDYWPGKEKRDKKSSDIVTIMLSSDTEVLDSEGQSVDMAEIKAGDVVCAKTDAANFALRITIKSSL